MEVGSRSRVQLVVFATHRHSDARLIRANWNTTPVGNPIGQPFVQGSGLHPPPTFERLSFLLAYVWADRKGLYRDMRCAT